jgi:hypothetical protein
MEVSWVVQDSSFYKMVIASRETGSSRLWQPETILAVNLPLERQEDPLVQWGKRATGHRRMGLDRNAAWHAQAG